MWATIQGGEKNGEKVIQIQCGGRTGFLPRVVNGGPHHFLWRGMGGVRFGENRLQQILTRVLRLDVMSLGWRRSIPLECEIFPFFFEGVGVNTTTVQKASGNTTKVRDPFRK